MSMKPFRDSGKPFISVYGLARRGDSERAPVTAGILFQRCVAEPDCKAKYTTAVRDMATVYDAAQLETVATRWYDQIKPHVQADPRKE